MGISLITLSILAEARMDASVKTTIEQRLVETGEKERLKEHLRNRLIESGWREELKLHAKEVGTGDWDTRGAFADPGEDGGCSTNTCVIH